MSSNYLDIPSDHLTDILLYGSDVYNDVTNKLILKQTIEYIRKSKRLEDIEVFLPNMFHLFVLLTPLPSLPFVSVSVCLSVLSALCYCYCGH